VELLVIWVSILIPIRISQIPQAGVVWSRFFGLAMSIVSVICASINIFLAFELAS